MKPKIAFVFVLSLLLAVATTQAQENVQFRGTELQNWTQKLPPEILGGSQIPLWLGLQEKWSVILATNPTTQITHLYFLPEGGESFQKVWDDSGEPTKLAELNSNGTISVTYPSLNKYGMVIITRAWPTEDAQSFFFDPETLEVKLLFAGGNDGIKVVVTNGSETVIFDYKIPWPTSKTTFVVPLDLAYSLSNGVYEFDSEMDTFRLLSSHRENGNELVRISQVVGDSENNLYWWVERNLYKFDRVPRALGIQADALVNSEQIVLRQLSYTNGYSESFSSLTPDGKITPLFGWSDDPNSSTPFNWLNVQNLNHNFGVFPARYPNNQINFMMWDGEELVPWIQGGNTLPGNLGIIHSLNRDIVYSWGVISVYQDTGLFFSFNEAGTKAEGLYWFKKSGDWKPPSLKIKRVVSATTFVTEKFSAGEIATLFFTGEQLPKAVTVAGVNAPTLYSFIEDGEGQVNFFLPDSLKGLKEVEVVLEGLDEDSFPVWIELDDNPLPKPFMTVVLRSDGTEIEPGFKFPVITADLLDENGDPILDQQGNRRQIYVGPNNDETTSFHPISGGSWATMWTTGCGFANIADGVPTPYPGVPINYSFNLYVGGVQPEIVWLGRTFAFRGLCQINFRVPSGITPRIPLPGEPPAPRDSVPMWFETYDGRRSEIFWLIVKQ
ncbi:MAG: hypothetical protein COV33_01730 [Candidatus Zambryskibacteria bacterium CG10_big_fil_rev_8_21_14_0_10_34_34]|uniref:Copper amine oxidase-like N-terminal domain-containing protein n=1 Tax=Candidatus Zambryskibacteria bacterium CG10_big_fil_rev_8_21_14_0_10_34_34 TaxID=1975114 RepID=A0A2H0R2H8_9BACT|nr:MAG: hypothetical protein COV33_01730 [Candidatus Zambryskibacteria bacterium CG10_big_fil_rev_8_21_14_0_10_34_34]